MFTPVGLPSLTPKPHFQDMEWRILIRKYSQHTEMNRILTQKQQESGKD